MRRSRRTPVAPRTAATLALAAVAAVLAVLAGTSGPAALAAEPMPGGTPAAATAAPEGGDARSSGEGAGLAGAPLVAIGAVAAIGVTSALATLAYVRLTGGAGERSR